jgi:ActD protein
MTRRIDVAVFADEHVLVDAARACREQGLDIVDVLSPHPVHGIDEVAGIRRTRLPAVTLAAGATGFALGTWFQLWTSAKDWPVDIGGKPWNSMAAFLPVTFELTVLFAGLATVAALFLRSRLRPGRAPRAPAEVLAAGVTDDRYALLVASPMGAHTAADMERLWARLGAESSHASFDEEAAR